jgi:hypothetical protein
VSKQTPNWNGRPILDQLHADALTHDSAHREFGEGLAQTDAEEMAYKNYAKKHHQDAAAHHFRGMNRTKDNGDLEAAKKHGLMYGLHMKALGHDALDEVPEDIKALADQAEENHKEHFKSHKADILASSALSS